MLVAWSIGCFLREMKLISERKRRIEIIRMYKIDAKDQKSASFISKF